MTWAVLAALIIGAAVGTGLTKWLTWLFSPAPPTATKGDYLASPCYECGNYTVYERVILSCDTCGTWSRED
jgi:hypothetical protein